MTATREHRNADSIERAVGMIGEAIEVTAILWSTLAHALPDDFPASDALNEIRDAHERLKEMVE